LTRPPGESARPELNEIESWRGMGPDGTAREHAVRWPLIAYSTSGDAPVEVIPVPSPKTRKWIDDTPNRFARRCLPLMVASQAGWILPTPIGFRARWDGSPHAGGIEIQPSDPDHPARDWMSDHFGSGIVTFRVPYIFRTPPGIGLLVRGAPNFWIAGAHPLEGLVETDWSTMTFTMNWRILAPDQWVQFEAGDPVCFLQPISIDLIETAAPVIKRLAEAPEIDTPYTDWSQARRAFNADAARRPEAWQKDYFLGKGAGGEPVDTHRTRVRVAPFQDGPGAARTRKSAPRPLARPEPAMPSAPPAKEYPGAAPGYKKVAGLAARELGDEFVVTDAQQRAHRLNPSAMFILDCCDGDAGSTDIAQMVQEVFGLPDPPHDLVRECLIDLSRAGLITRPTENDPDNSA